jgi:hypothetical protein
MFRYKIVTLLMLLVLFAAIPPMIRAVGCSRPIDEAERLQKQNELYKLVRIAFPPETRRVLDEPDRFTLFSIEGEDEILPHVTEQSFHGFNILGKTEITDVEERRSLVKALDDGISKVTHGLALCFAPRHGITVVQGDTRFDLVICFECSQIHVLDSNGRHVFRTNTTDDPAALFNRVLESAQIPLARPPSY